MYAQIFLRSSQIVQMPLNSFNVEKCSIIYTRHEIFPFLFYFYFFKFFIALSIKGRGKKKLSEHCVLIIMDAL